MKDSEIPMIESAIEKLWAALETMLDILGEGSAFYVEVGDTPVPPPRMKCLTKQKQSKMKCKKSLNVDKV